MTCTVSSDAWRTIAAKGAEAARPAADARPVPRGTAGGLPAIQRSRRGRRQSLGEAAARRLPRAGLPCRRDLRRRACLHMLASFICSGRLYRVNTGPDALLVKQMRCPIYVMTRSRVNVGFSASVAAMDRIASGGISYALADTKSRLPFLEVRLWLRRHEATQPDRFASTSSQRLDWQHKRAGQVLC